MTEPTKEDLRNAAEATARIAIESDLIGECRADMLETAAEMYRMSNWLHDPDSKL